MIHKTAIIDSNAKISQNVTIGPYSVIGPNVEIGDGTVIQSHVNITGNYIFIINDRRVCLQRKLLDTLRKRNNNFNNEWFYYLPLLILSL